MMAEHRAVGGKEGRGFAIAVAAHVLIIRLLSIQWTAGERRFDHPPMDVDLIAQTAVHSPAPIIIDTPTAARFCQAEEVDIAAHTPVPDLTLPCPPDPPDLPPPTPPS